MTDRIPLIVNAGAAQIQELPAGDNLSITGNITANYFIGNGSQLTGISSSANVDFTAVASNIIPTGNSVYNLGNAAHQWGSLYLSNATIYMNGVAIGLTAGNVLTVDGNNVVTTNSSGVANIGNLSINGASIALGSGATETLINISPNVDSFSYVQVPNDATANVANLRIHNDAGNIEFGTSSGGHLWYLDKDGALNLSNVGTVRGGSGPVNLASNNFVQMQWVDSGNIGISDPNSTGGPTNWAYIEQNGFVIELGVNAGNSHAWIYDLNGNLTLPGNTFSVNYANGTPVTLGGSTGQIGFDQYNIYNTTGSGIVISNYNYVSAEAETAYINIPAGDSTGDLQIVQEKGNVVINANSNATWSFNADSSLRLPNNGNITVVDNVITEINAVATANSAIGLRAFDNNGNTMASSFFDGADGTLNFYSYNPAIDTNYNWRFDNGGSFTLPNAPGNVYFGEDANGPVIIPFNTGMVINANRADAEADYVHVGQDGIDLFSVNPININNSTTGLLNTDINILSGDDIKLQGRNKPDDTESEGGDINIWAGQGANSTQTGFDTNGGGDISIQGGAGGLAQGATTNGGSGGYIELLAGDGGTSLDSVVGSGGSLTLTAGSAASPSDPSLGGWGGSVYISAGHTTRVNENGGAIELTTGQSAGGGYGAAGYVSINIPTSNAGPGGSWYFTGTGRELNVPADSSIFGPNFGNFTVGCAGNTIVTSSDYGANVKNWTFGYTGILSLPGIDTTGGAEAMTVSGTRTVVGGFDNPNGNYASTFSGNTATLVYTATSSIVYSAKLTFVIESNYATWNWEQFDVVVSKNSSGGVDVMVSNRTNYNPANGDTQVTASVNGGNIIEIYLTQPGTGTAYVNYTSVEFKGMVD